jgi:uncharacterized protein with HEPN domain
MADERIRERLRHTYDQVSDRRVWQIITDDLAPLRSAVEELLNKINTTKTS